MFFYAQKIDLVRAHLFSLCKVPDLNEFLLFDPEKKQTLLYEIDRFSDTINSRSIQFLGLTYKQVLSKILEELNKQKDFQENCEAFKTDCISNFNSTILRWSPKLEYEISKILQGGIGTVEGHTLLLDVQKPTRPLQMWRKRVDMSSLPVLTNQPCKLREPRNSEWPDFFSETKVPSTILVRSFDGVWVQIDLRKPNDLGASYKEPLDIVDAIQFSSIPHSSPTKPGCFLALKQQEVSIACLGDIKSIASFPHGIEDPDFLESYLLPTDTIIVRVGKRNLHTGGLQNEDFFSFKQNDVRAITPYVLQSEELLMVESMSKVDSEYPWTFQDTSSCLTGFNDLAVGQSKVLWKQNELVLGNSFLVAVFGHPGNFYTVFFDGTVTVHEKNASTTLCKLNFPITHAMLKF